MLLSLICYLCYGMYPGVVRFSEALGHVEILGILFSRRKLLGEAVYRRVGHTQCFL